jgi:hydroxymethylglutaryl-CoA lyase
MAPPRIFEQTLRDGLGSYPPLPPSVKAKLTDRLVDAGVDYLEVVRYPTADDRPQFQNPRAILEAVAPYRDRATVATFGMGQAGIEQALEHADLFDELHIPSFASDAYGLFALGENWEATLRRVQGAFEGCKAAGVRLTVGLGTSFGCPIDWTHNPTITAGRARDLASIGVDTVMLGDTAGQATPNTVRTVVSQVQSRCTLNLLRVHFHDTFGRGLLNTWEAVRSGIQGVDSSLLGLGGERYSYFRAADHVNNGNCATEELVGMLADELGGAGRYDPGKLNETARWLFTHIKGTVFGRSSFAELIPVPAEESDEVPQGAHRH